MLSRAQNTFHHNPRLRGPVSSTLLNVQKNAKIRNQYNKVPRVTQDTIWESDKNTRKYHIQESQEDKHSPAGDHKAARKRKAV